MDRRYRRSPDALSANVGEDVVALQAVRGFAYGMEKVTASVWQQLAEPRSLDEIVAALCEEYEVGEAQCRRELGKLLREMVDEGLVEELDG